MEFFNIYLQALFPVVLFMTILWIISVIIKDASIVDPFWSIGFILASSWYFLEGQGNDARKVILLILVIAWGLRLFIHLFTRFVRSPEEDPRYRNFRENYGPHRYWWFSFFQVFLLQGMLLWIISIPLLAAMQFQADQPPGILEALGILFWIIGFSFEVVGDHQLSRFRRNPANRGRLMTSGLRRWTRHPQYFGEAVIWWGFGLFAVGAGAWWTLPAPLLMTFLLLRVSGISMLERSLKDKPGFEEYASETPAFFPKIRLCSGRTPEKNH